jgi:hypothetical protein
MIGIRILVGVAVLLFARQGLAHHSGAMFDNFAPLPTLSKRRLHDRGSL